LSADRSEPVVILRDALARADRRTNLPPLDFALGSGVHALVGQPADGLLAVAKLVGGIAPLGAGQVTVAGQRPHRDPAIRRRIGVTLEKARLPDVGRVGEYLARAAGLRGIETDPERALDAFRLAHWKMRTLASLSHAEARALELVAALTTPDPVTLVLTEPGADVAPLDRRALRDALFRAADAGACVMIVTASTSDAIELASTIQLLERGRIARWIPVDESAALVPGLGTALRVEVDLPRLLVAALADDPAVAGLDWNPEGQRSIVWIRGDDMDRLALAVARAAVSSGANIRAMSPAPPHLEAIRAAASGLALAAYHAAYQAYFAYQAQQPGAAPPQEST
jgi:ABC-2 type transport system ATP-binding protein